MAVSQLMDSQLSLTFSAGEDEVTGELLFKTKSFRNVKTTATPDALHAVAIAFQGLQQYPLYMIERKDDSEIRAV